MSLSVEISDWQAELKESLFAVRDARAGLENQTKADIVELSGFHAPPHLCLKIIKAFAVLHGRVDPARIEHTGYRVIMADFRPKGELIQDLIHGFDDFDFDGVKDDVFVKVDELLEGGIDPRYLNNINRTAGAICAWVNAAHRRLRATRELRRLMQK